MTDLYTLYQNMVRDDIILSFKGDITQDLLTSVYQIMESHLDTSLEEPRRKKKLYHILVECLQNVYHHMEALKNDTKNTGDEETNSAIFMIARGDETGYRILTGNHIRTANVDDLRNKIDKINAMTHDELRVYYRQQLSATELSDKGGAGLGMIDIARKSGHKIDYSFQPVTDTFSFFSLIVNIN